MPSSSERQERQPCEMDTPGPSKAPSRCSQPTAVFEIEEERNRSRKVTRLCGSDPLLAGTLVAVVVGMVAGLTIKAAAGSVSSTALELIGLPGEVMLRLLKMLVLPLVAGSMIAGIAAMRGSSASQFSRVAKWTVGAYAGTTAVAVLLGVVLVTTIRPGRGSALADMSSTDCQQQAHATIQHHAAEEDTESPVDALLGVVRSAFPDNMAKAAVDTNVLGVITFSLLLGAALASLSPQAEPVLEAVDVFNAAIGKVVGWVVATSPIGIASLIAASILRTCDLAATLEALGLFVLTVLLALLIQAAVVLPAFLYAFARKAPLPVIKAFSQALLTAFGTSSSSAALPVNMACAERYGIHPDIIRFVLPLGSTINMNGSALYEAVAVIFLAQANGEQLSIPQLLVVAFTATLAAVGSAPIPSAGLVTMLIVLQAVGLDKYADDLAVLLALDWLLDRCRTTVNVLGDAFTVVVVDSRSQQPSRIARRGYAAVEAHEEALASRTDEDGFDRPAVADANGHPPPL